MPTSIAFIGVKEDKNNGILKVKGALRGSVTVSEMKLEDSRFKLGSLDSMLLNLERSKKVEMNSENFLKRLEKTFTDLQPEKKLTSYNLDSKTYGSIDIKNFVNKFEWDDIKYPRSASLTDQIKHIEDKLSAMEKNLRVKQQNYSDSKTIVANTFDKKETISGFINRDLNETIMEMMTSKKHKNLRSDLFVNSEQLQSVIVFVPKANIDKFEENYEFANEYILPRSWVELTEQFDYIMGHMIVFKRVVDDVKLVLKTEYKAITKDFEYNPEKAKQKEQDKTKLLSQNKTDKELLSSTCIESFREILVMLIHVKIYTVVIDSNLRFGSFKNFKVASLYFDRKKEGRLLQNLIKIFAEPDKIDFYGTKDQLNDVEDFFPFVYAILPIQL